MIASLISEALEDNRQALHSSFVGAKPFSHLVIDNFLTLEFADQLRQEFPNFDENLATDESGKVGLKCVHEDVNGLGSSYQQLDTLLQSHDFRDLISDVTGIPDLIHDPHYFGGGTHENRSGQDLDLHIDFNYHPINNQHRRLNIILFLNKDWHQAWGGALELCEDPANPSPSVSILPAFNRAVIFATTEYSWHGFQRIEAPDGRELSRKSFALYYYTKSRPDNEVARHHSTVYVERPLPDTLQPGETLSESDYKDIRRLINRRDQHIARLYGDIENLMTELDLHRSSFVMRQARRAVNLLAKIRRVFS